MPQILKTIARHYDTRQRRTVWTANGRSFEGRGAHMRALAAARATERLSDLLADARAAARVRAVRTMRKGA